MKPPAAILLLLLAGCSSIKPAAIGPRVQGIHESRIIQAQQAATITQAAAQSREVGREVVAIRTLAHRIADKQAIVTQWEDYQLRKKYNHPPK